jgi:ribosomal protein S18 acetylase RimI-like enzyme
LHLGDNLTLIRDAEWADLDELLRLQGLAGEGMDELGPHFAAGSCTSERLRRGLQSILRARPGSVVVAESRTGGGLMGYVMTTVAENEPFSTPRYGYVICLYVGQEYRDRGTGNALQEAVEGRFREEGLQAAQVEVSGRDLAAQSLWRSRGFETFLDRLWRLADSTICAEEDPDYLVRPAHSGDREAVVRLWKEMMDIHAAVDERLKIAPDWRDQVEHSVKHWLRDHDSRLIVAEAANGVIGFALGGLVRPTFGFGPPEYGHIAHLCVSSEFRRRSVGRQLFASLGDWFVRRRVACIHLYVSSLNPVSRQFWRAMGFEDCASRLWRYLV